MHLVPNTTSQDWLSVKCSYISAWGLWILEDYVSGRVLDEISAYAREVSAAAVDIIRHFMVLGTIFQTNMAIHYYCYYGDRNLLDLDGVDWGQEQREEDCQTRAEYDYT